MMLVELSSSKASGFCCWPLSFVCGGWTRTGPRTHDVNKTDRNMTLPWSGCFQIEVNNMETSFPLSQTEGGSQSLPEPVYPQKHCCRHLRRCPSLTAES